MMGLETIRKINAQAARKAKNKRTRPVVVTQEMIDDLKAGHPKFQIPMIGDFRPRGYTLERTLFVDISGLGAPDEPALTMEQFAREMKPGMAYAMVEQGQFQGYVGEFTPPKKGA